MNSGPSVQTKIHVFRFHLYAGLWLASAVIGIDKHETENPSNLGSAVQNI